MASNNVRVVIGLFCKILGDHGISDDVRPETLRQAKFNRNVITNQMWKILYDVVRYLDPSGDKFKVLDEIAEQLSYVKRRLQNLGYLSKAFGEIPSSLSRGSREILLALGWIVHTGDLCHEIVLKRTNPLHQDLLSFTGRIAWKPSPTEISQIENLPNKGKLQRQLMLCGKLKLKLRRLYASQQELAHLCAEIKECTVGSSLQFDLNYLTPLEVFLIRYPDSLGKMMSILDEDNAKLKRLLEWKEKEHIFWEWLDSVLTLHIEEDIQNVEEEVLQEESVFLDVPLDIGSQLCAMRSQVREFIISHEDDIENLELSTQTKKVSKIDLELIKYQVERELVELSQQFSLYDKRKFELEREVNHQTPMTHTKSILNSVETVANGRGQRNQRYLPQTAQSRKSSREKQTVELMQEEISALQKEVNVLEAQLKQLQITNLQKLQSITELDDQGIYILPRHFKQIFNS